MDVLDVAPYLVAFVEARAPELKGRVAPAADECGLAPPFCLYTRVGGYRPNDHAGATGVSVVRYQVDVWDADRDRGVRLADAITGTRADPGGLDNYRGRLPAAGVGGRAVFVQHARLLDGFEDAPPAAHGEHTTLHRASRDYRIAFNERLEAVP